MSEQASSADSLDQLDQAVGTILASIFGEDADRESTPNSTPIILLVGRSKSESANGRKKSRKISASAIPSLARHWAAVRVGDSVWEMLKDNSDEVHTKESEWGRAEKRFQMQFEVGATTWGTAEIRNKGNGNDPLYQECV